ncbi:MAG: single-stranded DNA-binding protein [Vampirovibrionales bacterium]|nr:single-stranded DNA-binding protein [Vampirovibrionales bacterium]
MNSVILLGRLGQDPEIKYFDSGSVKAKFSLAVDRPTANKENRVTDWFNIEVWGKQAEFVGEWVKKGTLVTVVGQMEINRYNDQAGNSKEWLLIRASEVRFAGSKRDNQQSGDFGANSSYGGGNVPVSQFGANPVPF